MTPEFGPYLRTFPWAIDFAGWGSSPDREINEDFVISVLMGDLRGERLGGLFPASMQPVGLADLPTGVRMHNVLHREGLATFEAISDLTVDDLSGLRNAGVGSVQQLLTALVRHAVFSKPEPGGEATIEVPTADQPPTWHAEVLGDIATLAKWHRLLGAEEAPVFSAIEGLSEPRGVRAARARLAHLSAALVLPPAPEGGEAAATVSRALDGLDECALAVVRERLVADVPATLDNLGAHFEVTRERIRQIETKTKALLRARLDVGDLATLAGAVRDAIRPFIPLRSLLQRYPSIGEEVPSLGQPVWRVLDRLDDDYEIKDGWCSTGTISDAVSRTRELLRTAAAGREFVELAAIESDFELSPAWLEYARITLLRGCALIDTPSIPDRAEVILFTEEAPMTAEEIRGALGVERALNAVKNALAVDDRFTRVDRDRWALARWGLEGYKSIRVMIGRAIDASGGDVALDELVSELSSKFDISPNSVVTYAAAHPYVTQRGRVRRRGRRDMRRIVRRKGLAQTRGLYRHPTSVKLRFVVNAEHLRGSGTPLPSALGEELDLSLNEERLLPLAGGGSVQVSWRGPQISVGSVKREMERLELEAGSVAFFVFERDGSLAIEPLATGSSFADRLASATGGPWVDPEDLFEELADRIDAPATTRDGVVSALSARGDAYVLEIIEQLDPEHGAPAPTVESRTAVEGAARQGDARPKRTHRAFEEIFMHLLENVDVWTAQTYRAGADFAPYVQGLREYGGGFSCELSSNAFLFPPMSEDQLESLRFLGWLDPVPTDSLPNHHQFFGPDVDPGRIAEILAKTLLDAVQLTELDDIEFGPHSPELDAFVAGRLAQQD